jgi:hypothetical protein
MPYLALALALVLFLACRKAYLANAGSHQIALCVHSKSSSKCQSLSLIDATSDQLMSGLNKKCFTSVDLVNVSHFRASSILFDD